MAAGAGDDFAGGREEPVAPAFDVPGLGVVPVREEHAGWTGDVPEFLDMTVRLAILKVNSLR